MTAIITTEIFCYKCLNQADTREFFSGKPMIKEARLNAKEDGWRYKKNPNYDASFDLDEKMIDICPACWAKFY